MLRIKDIIIMFGISKTTVYAWMKKGMPHIYIGKLLFFDCDEVMIWVKQHE